MAVFVASLPLWDHFQTLMHLAWQHPEVTFHLAQSDWEALPRLPNLIGEKPVHPPSNNVLIHPAGEDFSRLPSRKHRELPITTHFLLVGNFDVYWPDFGIRPVTLVIPRNLPLTINMRQFLESRALPSLLDVIEVSSILRRYILFNRNYRLALHRIGDLVRTGLLHPNTLCWIHAQGESPILKLYGLYSEEGYIGLLNPEYEWFLHVQTVRSQLEGKEMSIHRLFRLFWPGSISTFAHMFDVDPKWLKESLERNDEELRIFILQYLQ